MLRCPLQAHNNIMYDAAFIELGTLYLSGLSEAKISFASNSSISQNDSISLTDTMSSCYASLII